MGRFQKALLKGLFPHTAVVLALVPTAAALLIYAFAAPDAHEALQYASYALSFYALVLLAVRMPGIFRFCTGLKNRNKYIARYGSDAHWRVALSLAGALTANGAYALFHLGLGICHRAGWYYALAAYYLLLTVMRLLLFRATLSQQGSLRERLKKEWILYRSCGAMLAAMNLALSSVVFYMIHQNRAFVHHEITVITMASYTFGSFAMAILNVIKYKKLNSPLYSASKAISLAAAAVSMLTLENTMIASVGTENEEPFRRMMTGFTGGAVCAFVLGLAMYMMIHAARQLRKMESEGSDRSAQQMR